MLKMKILFYIIVTLCSVLVEILCSSVYYREASEAKLRSQQNCYNKLVIMRKGMKLAISDANTIIG
jgi:hypothetical protein